jgi:TRAP-type C4-dicarboxylate transport system permease small subunit
MVLLTFRLLQVTWRIWRGSDELLIASHEAEDMVEQAAAAQTRDGD